MYMSACKNMNQQSAFYPLTGYWLFKALVIILVLTGLLGIKTMPVSAGSQMADMPISVIDGTSPPQLQSEDQQNPAVVSLPDKNKWLVVWEDWRNWNVTGADIYGRFIDGKGNYCGNEFIICNQPGNQTMPTLAYRQAGSTILVAWQDTRGTVDSGFIYYNTINVAFLDANGAGFTLSGETAVAYTSIGGDGLISRKLPKAAYDTARDLFWLVWVESRNALQRIEEYAFGVSAARVTWRFGDTESIGYATIQGWEPTTIQTEIIRNGGASSNTSIRQISHLTTKDKDTYTYEYFTGVNNITVACDKLTAETLIAWEGTRGKATLTCTFEEHEAEFCTIEGSGEEATETCETRPMVEGASADDYFLSELELGTWEGDDDGQVHIYTLFDKHINQTVVHSRRLDSTGIAAHYPSAAFEPVGRKFLIAWEAQQDNGFSKIYGQLLFSGGNPYGANLLLSNLDADGDGTQDDEIATSNQTLPNIAVDGTNQLFLVTWQDGRHSQVSEENLDIYGQFVDCEGSLRGNNYAINTNGANQCCPHAFYNLGTHQFLMVWKDARNFLNTHSDIFGQRFDLADLQVYNNGQAATQIVLSDGSSNATYSPVELGFPTIEANSSIARNITVKNEATSTMVVESFDTTTKEFNVSNLEAGDEIPAGGSLTFSVIFSPNCLGNFTDSLSLVFSSQTEGTLIPCSVNLSGKAIGAYILRKADSFTADRTYQLKVNAFTEQPGHLYVLLIHDPASGGIIYALTPAGDIVPFPYTSPFGWQDMYFAFESSPSKSVDLSTINLQQLGCSSCPGPFAINTGGESFMFGNTISIQPPDDTPYNCAADFKYLTGNLYVATYITDGTPGMPFDFNRGLVELLWLKINNLNGSWRVTSEYYGENRVHSTLLQIQENNGIINAQWGNYHPTISYSTTDSAYIIDFTLDGYHYTYTINQLTTSSFAGTYHCEYNGTVIVDQAGVSGVRVQ